MDCNPAWKFAMLPVPVQVVRAIRSARDWPEVLRTGFAKLLYFLTMSFAVSLVGCIAARPSRRMARIPSFVVRLTLPCSFSSRLLRTACARGSFTVKWVPRFHRFIVQLPTS